MTARGIRNCNPGNIRRGADWKGLKAEQDDPDFCQFESMEWGCRALIRTLVTYRKKYHLTTVRQIIRRWAPPAENDSTAYMKHVASAIGRDVDESLPFDTDPTYYLAIAKVIARHENGLDAMSISDDVWEEAFKLAGF